VCILLLLHMIFGIRCWDGLRAGYDIIFICGEVGWVFCGTATPIEVVGERAEFAQLPQSG